VLCQELEAHTAEAGGQARHLNFDLHAWPLAFRSAKTLRTIPFPHVG
jgi:hypothetical protein